MTQVISIDQPRCSRCKAFRPASELNGYDPVAPTGQKYREAYCRRLHECDSAQAREHLEGIRKALEQAD